MPVLFSASRCTQNIFSCLVKKKAFIGVSGRNMSAKIDHAIDMLPTIKNRYCHLESGASSGMCPTAQDKNPLTTELKAANTNAFRGGCSFFLYHPAMIRLIPGTMIASSAPITKRTTIRPSKLWHAGMRRAIADQPIEQQQRYLAAGNLWMRADEGNMPTRAPRERIEPSQEYC
jgi:hypothetical protein